MPLMLQRRLALLWAIAFLTIALTASPTATLSLMPPATQFAMAAIGIAAIVFLMPGTIPRLRTSRARVRVFPSGHRDQPSAAITLAAGTGMCTPDEPNRSAADDALDLVRMDDDGGRQTPRPAA